MAGAGATVTIIMAMPMMGYTGNVDDDGGSGADDDCNGIADAGAN